ncbi:MAG: V-type ATP synthase subunit I [Sphaerochaetaceae bacterium]
MSLFTVPMRLLTAVVLESKTDTVVQELLRLGVLDFIHVDTLAYEKAAKLLTRNETVDRTAIADVRHRIEALYRQAGFPVPGPRQLDLNELRALSLPACSEQLDALNDELQILREKQKGINQALIRVDELLRYCKEGKLQYLDIRVGEVEHGHLETLEDRLSSFAHLILPNEENQGEVVLSLRRDGSQVTPLLDKFGWTESVQVSKQRNALKRLIESLERQHAGLSDGLSAAKAQVASRIKVEETSLDAMWCNLRLHELLGEIESNFSHTRNTTIFSGWVPKDSCAELEEGIRSASDGECVIEWIDAQEMPRAEVPVAVREIPALSPFQKIVDNYSVPEYGTISPTPFVAVSYLAMFGLMFGDAGQGLAILLIGLLGLRHFSKPGIPQQGGMLTANLCRLFLYLGGASIITGILFGSYFGYELFEPLWFNYHAVVMGTAHAAGPIQDVYDILGITIRFGILVIGTGLILNWINLIRKQDFFNLVFDKNGVLGGWLFGCGIWAAFYFVGTGYKTLPTGLFLPLAFGIPIVLLLAKVPVHRFLLRKNGQEVEPKSLGGLIMECVMEWVVDLLEIFSGFLANTLSFMRVAGLGIAHVSLMAAFADMSALVGGGAVGILVMLVGNALVIALEGLSAGIQALRLNYYEFFTKYFTGKGLAYNPVALHPHAGRQVKI